MKALDTIDKEILKKLQENARIPLKDLSAEVFLTTPAVSARIEKLEKEGYLKGYHAEVDIEKLGYVVKAYIMITVKPEDIKKFYTFVGKQECVMECSHITGPYSMIVKVAFPSTVMLEIFLGKLQSFGKTETQVVFSTFIENH